MKHMFAALAALLVLSSGVSQAQELTGTWQGKLQLPTNAELRLVVKITKDAAGAWRPVVYSIDQTPQGVTGTVTLQGTTITIVVPAFGATIDGKLSADGNTIAGTFTQGGKLPLNLARATGDAVWEIPEAPAALRMMPTDANPSFEVATIKPARPEDRRYGITFRGRDVVTFGTTLMNLVTFAYGVHPKQVEGLPEWATTDKYEITARPEGTGIPNDRQLKLLFQKLLAERFKLALHRDKKEQSVYALTAARAGSKMTPSAGDPNGLPGLAFQGLGKLVVVNATMADFAGLFQTSVLDRPVVDQTGITGRYDFTLNWTPDESQFRGMGLTIPPPPDNATLPSLFTAIQEQVGLRLESTRAPADVLVVDKAEKPTEN